MVSNAPKRSPTPRGLSPRRNAATRVAHAAQQRVARHLHLSPAAAHHRAGQSLRQLRAHPPPPRRSRVEEALKGMDKVRAVKVDLDAKMATVEVDVPSLMDAMGLLQPLVQAVKDLGFEAGAREGAAAPCRLGHACMCAPCRRPHHPPSLARHAPCRAPHCPLMLADRVASMCRFVMPARRFCTVHAQHSRCELVEQGTACALLCALRPLLTWSVSTACAASHLHQHRPCANAVRSNQPAHCKKQPTCARHQLRPSYVTGRLAVRGGVMTQAVAAIHVFQNRLLAFCWSQAGRCTPSIQAWLLVRRWPGLAPCCR